MATEMGERRAQVVLMVRAVEEVDREGRILPFHARAAATRRALMVTGLAGSDVEIAGAPNMRSGETVIRRSRLLFESLQRKMPGLPLVLAASRLEAGTNPALVLAGLLTGLSTNVLGSAGRIHLLSFPLLGLLAWNLCICVAKLAWRVYRWSGGGAGADSERRGWLGPGGPSSRMAALLLKFVIGLRLRRWESTRTVTQTAAKAVLRFGALWRRAGRRLLASRLRRSLHLAAVATVAGVLAGMYLRALGLEYRAGWESTLLSARHVQAFLDVLLAPAAFVAGLEVPEVPPAGVPAGLGQTAVWIHLYALTALLCVALPRGLMALVEALRCRRMAARMELDLDEPYYAKLFTAWRGSRRNLEIVPYSYRPKQPALTVLQLLLHDFFGARADVRVHRPVDYGDPPPDALGPAQAVDDDRDTCIVALFNMAQTPEIDVHGAFLQELKTHADSGRTRIVVYVDVSDYRQRVPLPHRWEERDRAWRDVAREADLATVPLDPDAPVNDDALATLAFALWPPAAERASED